jgi:UDP-N-acetylglucosamine--N-acetylmuramyl-(pentapeptide) pyrophosphoryl-undecaprenol N-acetylglucosamine transferase
VVPALAIARELRDRYDAEVHFVGTARGLETRLVPAAGFHLDLIRVGQLKGVSLKTRINTLLDLPRGVLRCRQLIQSFRPDVSIGVGGYASGPAMMASILARVPTLAFEPNAVPGLANRLIGRWVSAAAVNFAATGHYFRNAEVTGIPVRPEFFAIPPRPPQTDDSAARLQLLVFGGSQGSRFLNQMLPRIAPALFRSLKAEVSILHQSGAAHYESTLDAYKQGGADPARWQVVSYLDDMPQRFADADLILCRSGASTVAELAAAGRASVLVPFPQATDDHQRWNAEALVQAGGAVMLTEQEIYDPSVLLSELMMLLTDHRRRHLMATRVQALAHPDALQLIAEKVKRLAK